MVLEPTEPFNDCHYLSRPQLDANVLPASEAGSVARAIAIYNQWSSDLSRHRLDIGGRPNNFVSVSIC